MWQTLNILYHQLGETGVEEFEIAVNGTVGALIFVKESKFV